MEKEENGMEQSLSSLRQSVLTAMDKGFGEIIENIRDDRNLPATKGLSPKRKLEISIEVSPAIDGENMYCRVFSKTQLVEFPLVSEFKFPFGSISR